MRTVQNNITQSQFELYKDGQLVGVVRYRMHDDQMWLLSTQLDPLHDEPGLAESFIAKVLVDVRRRRIEILPYCHAVRRYMAHHPHFVSLMPEKKPGHFIFLHGTKSTRRVPTAKTHPSATVSMVA